MQRENQQLFNRLSDLTLISESVNIDKSFILGYICRNGEIGDVEGRVKQCVMVAELVEEAMVCQLITKASFLQLVAVLGYVSGQNHHKKTVNLVELYRQAIESILYDPNYLSKTYFYHQNHFSLLPNNKPHSNLSNTSTKIMMLPTKLQPHKLQNHQIMMVQKQQSHQQMKRNKSNIAECPVCMIEIKHHNICILSCGHIIHKDCFQACMKESILNKKFPLKCPFQDCSKYIETQDIQQYLPKQLVEKYYEFTLHNFVQKNTKNMSWCPTPGCSNAFQFDEEIRNFSCMKCEKEYCLKCRTQAHYSKSCEENLQGRIVAQEDKEFLEFAKGARYKQCPQCRFWVQKSKGCCHMTCRCQYQFCYVCGVKYGDCNCQQTYDNYYGSDDQENDSEYLQNDLPQSPNFIMSPLSDPHKEMQRQQKNDSNKNYSAPKLVHLYQKWEKYQQDDEDWQDQYAQQREQQQEDCI